MGTIVDGAEKNIFRRNLDWETDTAIQKKVVPCAYAYGRTNDIYLNICTRT